MSNTDSKRRVPEKKSDELQGAGNSQQLSEFLSGDFGQYYVYHYPYSNDARVYQTNMPGEEDSKLESKLQADEDAQYEKQDSKSFWDEYEEEKYEQVDAHVENLLSDYQQNAQRFHPKYYQPQYVRQSTAALENYPFLSGLPTIPSPKTYQMQIRDDDKKEYKFSKPVHNISAFEPYMPARPDPMFYSREGQGFIKLKEIHSIKDEKTPRMKVRGRESGLDDALHLKKKSAQLGIPLKSKSIDIQTITNPIYEPLISNGQTILPKSYSLIDTDSGLPLQIPYILNSYIPNEMLNVEIGNVQIKPKVKRQKHVCRACVHCKRAHLACDNQRPCKRCVHLGKTDCVDVEHKRRGRPKSTPDSKKSDVPVSILSNEKPLPDANQISHLCTGVLCRHEKE